jgi:hypothetical protein
MVLGFAQATQEQFTFKNSAIHFHRTAARTWLLSL